MPTKSNAALSSLDYKKKERHTLAIKFYYTAPTFEIPEWQKLIDEIKERLYNHHKEVSDYKLLY
ncbi:hypothetical protein AHAS_Ahas20G0163600 [Arachis hypogaea]